MTNLNHTTSPILAQTPFLAGVVMASSSSDILILALGVIIAALYLFRDQLFATSKPKATLVTNSKPTNGSANPRDFIAKMKVGVRNKTIVRLEV
jgi:NADPH-ferrihemoprotein reductase